MAGDWIKFRKALIRDGRVLEVARKCNATRVTTIGALVTLWCLGDEYCEENGTIPGYTADDLNMEIGVCGFVEALPPDWFAVVDGLPQLPAYQQHNGETAKQRACNARRVTRYRERVTQEALPEKRREEKRRTTTTPLSPASTNGQGGDGGGMEIDWGRAKARANEVCKSLGVPAPKEGKYRRLILQAAALADGNHGLGAEWLADANEDTRLAKPNKPWQYWAACLRTGAENRGVALGPLLAGLKVPAELREKKAEAAKEKP
jgi:hypothetical protein